MEFKDIKLVIWDLDETLWEGVLSEGKVILPVSHKKLIQDLVDRGIMCSICSKNDEKEVANQLEKNGIREYFVFNSVNWSPKGLRVKQIVEEMGLRFTNVLFIDDNPSNRGEVKAICGEITVADVDIIERLISECENTEPKDLRHKRLDQYKILETKQAFKANFGSNKEFLESSHIRVRIKNDCLEHIDRIAELVLRTNQLNFTKLRSSKEELTDLIKKEGVSAGYVCVSDDFGDYGITGFYCIEDGKLIHYVFSCRTLGMGVEQYVYRQIGCPSLTIQGDVSSDPAGPEPTWIKEEYTVRKDEKENKQRIKNSKIIIKGPCDMQIMFGYMVENRNIRTEFVYVSDRGVSIEGYNHTTHIVQSLSLSETEKERVSALYSFCDQKMFITSIFDPDVDAVVLSTFTDPNLGLYKHRKSGIRFAFGEYTNDLTDESKWERYINKELFVANCSFTTGELQKIKKELEFLGRLSPAQVLENIRFIYEHLAGKAALILVLGSETPYLDNASEAYNNREQYHRELNHLLREWGEDKPRVRFIDVNDYIMGQDSFTNNINHFQREVYYRMSHDLVQIVQELTGRKLKENGEIVAKLNVYIGKFKKIPDKAKKMIKGRGLF